MMRPLAVREDLWQDKKCATGTKLKLNGRLEEGFEHYRRAISACPAYAPAFYNIGVIHSERRDFAAAKQYYERALQVGHNATSWIFSIQGLTVCTPHYMRV